MADGNSNLTTDAPISRVADMSEDDILRLNECLLDIRALAQVVQAASISGVAVRDSGIYGTAELIGRSAQTAIDLIDV